MFITIALVCSVIATILDYFLFIKEKTVKEYVRVFFRNVFSVTFISLAVQRYVMHYDHFLVTAGYKTKNYVHFFIVSFAVAILLEVFYAFVNSRLSFTQSEPPKRNKTATAIRIISVVLFFLGCAAYFGTVWGLGAFGEVTGDQLIINLTSPTEGTEASVYTDGFEGPVFSTLLATVIFAVIIFSKFNIELIIKDKAHVIFNDLAKRIICFVLAMACIISGVAYGVDKFSLDTVYNAYVAKSDIIDKNYADPETTKVEFPQKKRNLIHIYLESVEVSFLSKELGGYMKKNLMPNLTRLADNGIVFSDTDEKFGGPQAGTGTQWSIASMVNQTSGLPMKAPGMANVYGNEGNFLPGAYTLGELLEREGYEQTVMFGASARFGGLEFYFKTHGNWKIMDYDYAIANKMLPKDYKVWWGFEDDKLYEFAKEEITRMYKTGKPFNFTMENADTHRPGGYVTPGKKKPFKSPYANAVWNSDRDVCEFIKWVMKQPFYENTTIVLIGDHNSMETDFFEYYKFDDKYQRKQFNLILNPDPSVANVDEKVTRNRMWSNWDMFPTIVSSIGGRIDGERLGIGTNLFSGKKTIFEEYGVDKANKELEKGSKLYNEEILGGMTLKGARKKTNFVSG